MSAANDSFEDARPKIAHFRSDMHRLLRQIREDAMELWATPTGYWTGIEHEYLEGDNPYFNNMSRFQRDLEGLALSFESFLEGGLKPLDRAVAHLEEVSDRITNANGYGGLENVRHALEKWHGGAASNFDDKVLDHIRRVFAGQQLLTKEVAVALKAIRSVIERGRADILDLADQTAKKLLRKSEEGDFDFGILLWIVGAAAAGTGLGEAAWAARIAWTAGVAGGMLNQVEKLSQSRVGHRPERRVEGFTPWEIIESAHDQIGHVIQHIRKEEGLVEDALNHDLRELDGKGIYIIVPQRPSILDADSPDDLGIPDPKLTEFNLVDLGRAARAEMPAMAEILDHAWSELTSVRSAVGSAVTGEWATGLVQLRLGNAMYALEDALARTRDYIYYAGEKLAWITQNYYDAEAANEQLAQDIEKALDGFTEPRYHGENPWPPVR